MGIKGPTLHEVSVTKLKKKKLALKKHLMKDYMVEWKKKMDVQLCWMDGTIGNREL